MNGPNDRLIEKIKKCLALAADARGDENVAATALRQAKKMMEEAGITPEEITAHGAAESKVKAGAKVKPPAWESLLVDRVEAAFGCKAIFHSGAGKWGFIGVGASHEIAAYAFAVLLRQCKAARAEVIRKAMRRLKPATRVRRADLLCQGWVIAASGNVGAKTVSLPERQAMDAYMDCEYSDRTALATTDRTTGKLTERELGTYYAGTLAGRNVTLHGAVGGGAGTTLAIGLNGAQQ